MINEQDAVRRCQSGDREAFRPIVEYYGDVLMGTLYLMTHDRAYFPSFIHCSAVPRPL